MWFKVDLGCYMEPLYFTVLNDAREFCNIVLRSEGIVLSIREVSKKGE